MPEVMSSTVNQLIDEQMKTRKYLSQHKRAIEQLETAVRNIVVDMNITFITIFKSERFSGWVTAVERKYELERRAKEDYRQKRISLETGRLTKHVMPSPSFRGSRLAQVNSKSTSRLRPDGGHPDGTERMYGP